MVLINSMFTGYIPSAFRVILDPSLEPLLERPDLWTTYVSMETIKPIEQATSWFCSMVGVVEVVLEVVDEEESIG